MLAEGKLSGRITCGSSLIMTHSGWGREASRESSVLHLPRVPGSLSAALFMLQRTIWRKE